MQSPVDTKVSAIVLNWKRPENVVKIIRYLEKRPYVDEVLVWNNAPLPFDSPSSSEKVRVINSPENFKDHAKYLACKEARNDVCFYQDDDWYTAPYIDLLYEVYQQNPLHLHAVTNAPTLAENLFWTYYDSQDIHSEFSWIGCGAMFPRDIAVNYLHLIETRFDRAMREMADRAFTCLINQPIVQIEVPLFPLNQDNAFSHDDFFAENKARVIDGIHRELPRLAQPLLALPDYRIRAINEGIALFSTISPVDYPYQSQVYKGVQEFESRSVENLKNCSYYEFLDCSYACALGPNPEKRWRADFKNGDSWGIASVETMDFEITIHCLSEDFDEQLWAIEDSEGARIPTLDETGLLEVKSRQSVRLTYRNVDCRTFEIKVKKKNTPA
ncbi:MAG: hypothetical protein KTR18_12485 [Acidiferrobacterales bacterium]|nr:hypothetical protein [Acidiferrobacterales bacterium]